MRITDVPNAVLRLYAALNKYLITRHPFLWQTQVHLVVLYALIFGSVIFFLGLLYPIRFQQLCSSATEIAKLRYNAGAVCISISILFLIYWRKKIVQYKNADFSWRFASLEALVYLAGVLMLWSASNMFVLGLNTRIAWLTLKGEKQYSEMLRETNFLVSGYIPHADSVKIHGLPDYFSHGESLLQQIMERVFDPEEPEFRAKRYYSDLNQVSDQEYFFNWDTSYTLIDSNKFEWKHRKKIFDPRWYITLKIDKQTLEKRDNFFQIDTGFTSNVFAKLRYSFDEFVPRLNYDNYTAVQATVPFERLGYQNYQKLIDSTQYFMLDILYEDYVRNAFVQKILAARRNFLQTLSPDQMLELLELHTEMHRVFPYGEFLYIECSLTRPIRPDQLNMWEQSKYLDYGTHYKYGYQEEETAHLNGQAEAMKRRIDSLAYADFSRDSLQLSNKLGKFVQSLNPEAQYWFKTCNDGVYAYLKPLLLEPSRESRRYLQFATDSLFTYFPTTTADSFQLKAESFLTHYQHDKKYYDAGPSYYGKLGNGYILENYIDSLAWELMKDYPAFNTLRRAIRVQENAIPKDFSFWPYDYYPDAAISNADETYTSIHDIIVNMAFPELRPTGWYFYNRIFNLKEQEYAYFIVRMGKHAAQYDSIHINQTSYQEGILKLYPALRKMVAQEAPDSIRQFFINQQRHLPIDYHANTIYKHLLNDTAIFKDVWHLYDLLENYNTATSGYNDLESLFPLNNFKDPYKGARVYLPQSNYLHGYDATALAFYHNYRFEKFRRFYTPENLRFFQINGFETPEMVADDRTAFRFMNYFGMDLLKGLREVHLARKRVLHFFSQGIFQRHILSLLIFLNAILFFSVSFETRVITAAFALAFLLLILLNFFLGKFFDNNAVVVFETFPSMRQKIVFATLLIPLLLSLMSLLVARRRIRMPGFLLNMVVVFALTLLTTNPHLYYGDKLQQVENPKITVNKGENAPITQYDLFYYLTLYLGIAVTAGSVLLRHNQVLPERRR